MSRSLVVAGFLAFSLIASPTLAWHEVGHMLTVLVAYKQLSPGDRPSQAIKKLVAILKQHPRFQEDIAGSMPKGLSEDAEARWLLCRASVWPDQIRADRDNPQLAKEKVYTPEIRGQILAADRAPSDDAQPGPVVKLPDNYRAAAHEIGKLRVVQGGYRIAEFLTRLLQGSAGPASPGRRGPR